MLTKFKWIYGIHIVGERLEKLKFEDDMKKKLYFAGFWFCL